MNKLPELVVTRSGFQVPESWHQVDGKPAPGVYVLVPKENLTKEVLSGVLDKMAWSEERGWDECAEAILARLAGGE